MNFIFHITTIDTWKAAKAKNFYDFDSLKTEGFIHCSTIDQYLEVANRIFAGQKDLVILKIDESKVAPKVVYENLEGGESLFPHIYGILNLEAVVGVIDFPPNADGSFSSPF